MANPASVILITHAGGAHVGAYLQALAAAEQCDQVLLADADGRWDEEARRVLGGKLGRVERDYRRLLSDTSPTMALITLEARLAPPAIDAALDARCHVLAEKPSCVRAEDFAPLVRKADSAHLYLMLALANRLNPEIQAARKLLSEGRIGRLFGLDMHLVADQTRLTRPAYHEQWFADKKRSGGGHLIWLGIHWLDLAMHLTGNSIADVAGFTANVGGQPINIEDSAVAALRFANGSLGTLTSGYYLDKGYQSHIKIWGEHGWLLIEPMNSRPLRWYSTRGDAAGREQIWDGSREPRGYSPFVHEAIRASGAMEDPPVSSADSLRALRAVFAIYEAARSARTVSLG